MKYLKYDLYEKCCAPDGEQYQNELNEQYEKYIPEFNSVLSRLPKGFLKEFGKKHFHDDIIKHMSIERIRLKKRYKYNLTMQLLDYGDESIVHNLVFSDIRIFKSNLDFFLPLGYSDWRYCELLPVDDKYLSLEVVLFDDSSIYIEFPRLHYKKEIIKA